MAKEKEIRELQKEIDKLENEIADIFDIYADKVSLLDDRPDKQVIVLKERNDIIKPFAYKKLELEKKLRQLEKY